MERLKIVALMSKTSFYVLVDFVLVTLTILACIREFIVGATVALFRRLFRGVSLHPEYSIGKEITNAGARRSVHYLQCLQAQDPHYYFRLQRKLFEIIIAPVNKRWENEGYTTFDYKADGVSCRAVCKKELEYEAKVLLELITVTTPENKAVRPDPKSSKIRWILQHHGGGYTSGTRISGQPVGHHFCEHASQRGKPYPVVTVIVDYGLAPEKQWPGAVVDAIKCFKFHSAKVGANKLVLAGESAGGGLVLCTLLALRDDLICLEREHLKELIERNANKDPACETERNVDVKDNKEKKYVHTNSQKGNVLNADNNEMPAAALVFSPMLSCMQDTKYCTVNASLDLITAQAVKTSARAYVPDQNLAKHPLASPINGEFHDLPPLLITAGDTEIFLPLIEKFADSAKEHSSHNHVHFRSFKGCHHSFQLDYCDTSKLLYEWAIDFIDEHTSNSIKAQPGDSVFKPNNPSSDGLASVSSAGTKVPATASLDDPTPFMDES